MRIASKLACGLGTVILILVLVSSVASFAFRSVDAKANDIAQFKLRALSNAQGEATAAIKALAFKKTFFARMIKRLKMPPLTLSLVSKNLSTPTSTSTNKCRNQWD